MSLKFLARKTTRARGRSHAFGSKIQAFDRRTKILGLDAPAGSQPLWFPLGAPAQVSFRGPCQSVQVKLAYMQMYANETNPAWALSQKPGDEEQGSAALALTHL